MKKFYCICVVATGLIHGSDKLKQPTKSTATVVPAFAVPLASAAPANQKPKALTARLSSDKDHKTAAANPKRATCPPVYGTHNIAVAPASMLVPMTGSSSSCTHGWAKEGNCPICRSGSYVMPPAPLPAHNVTSPLTVPVLQVIPTHNNTAVQENAVSALMQTLPPAPLTARVNESVAQEDVEVTESDVVLID